MMRLISRVRRPLLVSHRMCRQPSDKAFSSAHPMLATQRRQAPKPEPGNGALRPAPVSSRGEYPADWGITHGFRVVKGGANAPYAGSAHFQDKTSHGEHGAHREQRANRLFHLCAHGNRLNGIESTPFGYFGYFVVLAPGVMRLISRVRRPLLVPHRMCRRPSDKAFYSAHPMPVRRFSACFGVRRIKGGNLARG